MSWILTMALPALIVAALIGIIVIATRWQWYLLDRAWDQGFIDTHNTMLQTEFDAKFYADVKPFRESAERAGCDMAAFDMEVAARKARVDEFRANAHHFYQQRLGTPSGK